MRFDIRTAADAQALARVLEQFALRTLLPDRVEATHNDGMIDISLELEGLDEALAQLIIEKIRASVLVQKATLSARSTQYLDGVGL